MHPLHTILVLDAPLFFSLRRSLVDALSLSLCFCLSVSFSLVQRNIAPTQGMAISLGITLLVARRLALMRDHWAALRPLLEKMGEASGVSGKPNKPGGMALSASQSGGMGFNSATAVAYGSAGVGGGAARDRVMESGVFLLGLEVSAMLWLVGGWSSLVALRFRYTHRCFPCLGVSLISLFYAIERSRLGPSPRSILPLLYCKPRPCGRRAWLSLSPLPCSRLASVSSYLPAPAPGALFSFRVIMKHVEPKALLQRYCTPLENAGGREGRPMSGSSSRSSSTRTTEGFSLVRRSPLAV